MELSHLEVVIHAFPVSSKYRMGILIRGGMSVRYFAVFLLTSLFLHEAIAHDLGEAGNEVCEISYPVPPTFRSRDLYERIPESERPDYEAFEANLRKLPAGKVWQSPLQEQLYYKLKKADAVALVEMPEFESQVWQKSTLTDVLHLKAVRIPIAIREWIKPPVVELGSMFEPHSIEVVMSSGNLFSSVYQSSVHDLRNRADDSIREFRRQRSSVEKASSEGRISIAEREEELAKIEASRQGSFFGEVSSLTGLLELGGSSSSHLCGVDSLRPRMSYVFFLRSDSAGEYSFAGAQSIMSPEMSNSLLEVVPLLTSSEGN
ncbi:hypothetical protein [Parahalioglobus pacificus]|uniref:hypothetical protein n=1 Tax=Parahalioglobus pacificus TaxID=930806 RepID=UPI0016729764|nr:hypothetical protein [Halioglobus pacificus]